MPTLGVAGGVVTMRKGTRVILSAMGAVGLGAILSTIALVFAVA